MRILIHEMFKLQQMFKFIYVSNRIRLRLFKPEEYGVVEVENLSFLQVQEMVHLPYLLHLLLIFYIFNTLEAILPNIGDELHSIIQSSDHSEQMMILW